MCEYKRGFGARATCRAYMQIYATHIATNGDKTIASTTETTEFQFTHDPPNKPTAEPTKPPIRACEDDEGRLTLHVKKFQKIAANSAENTGTASAKIYSECKMERGKNAPAAMGTGRTCSDMRMPISSAFELRHVVFTIFAMVLATAVD